MNRGFITALSLFTLMAAAPFARAQEKEFNKTTEVSGVGYVRVVHRVPGEPVMSPDRFEVFVRCHHRKNEQLVESLSICDLKSYNIDKETKLVGVTFLSGRTDPSDGVTHCDIEDYKEIKLASVCKRHGKSQKKK